MLSRGGPAESRIALSQGIEGQLYGKSLIGVVVLLVQIGALCSENSLHDKHLRFLLFRAL